MAKPLIPWILFCKQKLIENTGSHKNGLTKAHRESVNIVWIILTVLFHLLEDRIRLLFSRCIEKANLTALINSIIGCIRKSVPSVTPIVEHLIDLFVVHEFLHKHIHFQCLKLRLTQERMRIFLAVIIRKKFSCEIIVTGTDFSTVGGVVVPKLLIKGKIRIKGSSHLTHLHFQ